MIDPETLSNTVRIRSLTAGIGNSWEAQPGKMLKQVADVELPQIYSSYQFSTDYRTPDQGRRRVTLYMTVPNYAFRDFHATVTVHVIAYKQRKADLFNKTYTESGVRIQARCQNVRTGAFGMKSAIRGSSLDAYRKFFADLRVNLGRVLASRNS